MKESSSDVPVIILGGGGHARVLISTLVLQNRKILGFSDPDEGRVPFLSVSRLGADEAILLHAAGSVRLVNGLGSIGSTAARRQVYERFHEKRYVFESVIHPSAIIAPQVQFEEGVQLMAGVIVQPGSRVGANSIINTGVQVDHDCWIGVHVHVAPGVVLSGGVRLGDGAHVGAGATIIQGISIGANSIVGAGALVINDVPPGVTAVGVPAKW